MSTRPREESTPDLFAALPVARAPEGTSAPAARAVESRDPVARPRLLLLPKDLAGALTRLGDGELDSLLVAATAEAERRGRLPRARAGVEPTTGARTASPPGGVR